MKIVEFKGKYYAEVHIKRFKDNADTRGHYNDIIYIPVSELEELKDYLNSTF